jgi:predicted metal-dependent hydrolase|tara:strand:- start:274 stop:996 length:723 start_codon:yes stop_codon:yes gene_type:complete
MLNAKFESTESIDLINGDTISYLLIKKYRRSIGLKITRDGLIVHAPIFVSKKHIKTVIISKQKWIESKLNLIKIKAPPFTIKTGQEFNLLGKKIILQLSEGRKGIFLQNNSCLLSFNDLNNQDKLKKYFIGWLKEYTLNYLMKRVDFYSENNNLLPKKVLLSNAKTKWGSCNSNKEVRLNWRLILSTEHIVDYVICHELSHLKFMNHSQQFWDLVGEIFPDYKEAQTQLKLIGFQLYQLD